MWEDKFAERMTELRIKKNVSSRDMSLSLGQSVSYMNKIENKKSFPTMATFFYICEHYFKITPAEFFQEENQNPEKLNQLTEKLKQLNETQFQIICDTVDEFLK